MKDYVQLVGKPLLDFLFYIFPQSQLDLNIDKP